MASLLFPVQGPITSPFGWRSGVNPLASRDFHTGIDIGVPLGTPIYATHSGRITYNEQGEAGGGHVIELYGANGWRTVYAHLNRYAGVRSGGYVHQGQLIGFSGMSGNATGPHLHYEVDRYLNGAWKPVNPMYAIPRSAGARNTGWLAQSGFRYNQDAATSQQAAQLGALRRYEQQLRDYREQQHMIQVRRQTGILGEYAEIAASQAPPIVNEAARAPRLGPRSTRPSRFAF
jgi:hypothetical protein